MSRPKMFTGPATPSEHKPHAEETRKKIGAAVKYVRVDQQTDRFLRAAGKYLRSVGWTALVAGPCRIERDPLMPEHRFRLVMEFTGGKKSEAAS